MISIIIVNYNTYECTNKCIDSIVTSNDLSIINEIIIVDNNSKNNSYQSPNVKIKNFQLDKNYGYSKALNFGIEQASGKYILTINPDVIVNTDTIKNIFKYYLDNHKIGVIGCKVLNVNLTFQLSSRRRFPYIKYILPYILKFQYFGFKNLYNYSDISEHQISTVDSVSGSFMLFSRDIYNIVGKFDERFFLYFEDTDFCIRIKRNGYKVVYYPNSTIIHLKNKSITRKNYLFVKFHFYKSFFKFYVKYFNDYFKIHK